MYQDKKSNQPTLIPSKLLFLLKIERKMNFPVRLHNKIAKNYRFFFMQSSQKWKNSASQLSYVFLEFDFKSKTHAIYIFVAGKKATNRKRYILYFIWCVTPLFKWQKFQWNSKSGRWKKNFFFSMQWRRKKCKELVKEKFVGSETCNKRLLCIYTMYKCVW